MALTHWKKLENPEYIGAYAFQPGEEKTLTIRNVRREIVVGAEGKKEECTVVHFCEDEKPLILNATNGKAIQKIAGSGYIEQWEGVRITLKVEAVKAFGDIVDAVRVSRKKPPQQVKPSVVLCADCHQAISGYGKQNAQEFAAYTQRCFGVPVCYACGQKRKTAKDAEAGRQEDAGGGEA